MKKERKKQKKINKNYFLFLYASVPLLFVIVGLAFSFWHNSQYTIPSVLDENHTMQTMPHDMNHVLGAQTNGKGVIYHIPILLYHYIEYVQNPHDTIRASLNVTPSVFTQQIITLQQAGYTFLTASDIDDILDGKKPLPVKPVAVTVDDGHWDVATDVLPILEKYHVKITAYIIPGFIGGSDFLSSQQLFQVARSGFVQIGAHTLHHLWLKGLPQATVNEEIVESKLTLQNLLHIPVTTFAYPYGAFDAQALQIAQQAGFYDAMSTLAGTLQTRENRYYLNRIRPGYLTGQALIAYMNQTRF